MTKNTAKNKPSGIRAKHVRRWRGGGATEGTLLRLDAEGLIQDSQEKRNTCCPGAAAAAMAAGKKLGAKKGILVNYITSYDIRPDSSFVGYAGVVF